MKIFLLTLIFNALALNVLFSQQVISLTDDNPSFKISKDIYVYEDVKRELNFEQVSADDFQSEFKIYGKEKINFGFSSSNVWIRLKIQNNSTSRYPWFLEMDYAPLDSIIVHYKSDDASWKSSAMGDQVPLDQWPVFHKCAVFPFEQYDNDVHTYFIRVRSKGGMQIPMVMKEYETFQRDTLTNDIIFGFFYGIMLVMFLYNLLIYIAIRISSYLYYCLYILGFTMTQSGMIGHGYQFIWGNSMWFAEIVIPIGLGAGMLFALLFATKFLNTKKYIPVWHKLMRAFTVLAAILMISPIFIDYNIIIKINTVYTLLMCMVMLIVGSISLYKGNRSAMYYVIAWGFVLTGLILAIMMTAGILPRSFILVNGVSFGGAFEVIFLSLALADRINQYRNEKENAQAAALAHLEENERIVREQNKILEQKVAERTKEIESQNQEISTQNEELHQQQEEITAQRDFIEKKNQELSRKNFQIETSINTAQTIQQAILPIDQKLAELFLDFFVLYRPKDIVSGDFYWADKVDGKIIVAAIDCTGHGVPGAFMSLIGSTQLDKIVRVSNHTKPAEILTHLHHEVRHLLRQDQTGSKHGMDAAIVAIEPIDNETVSIIFSGAKRPLYYLDEQGNLKTIKGDRRSIGGIQNEKKVFTNQNVTIPKNGTIYIGSDGFEDQNDVSRKKLGSAQFQSFLNEIKTLPLYDQKNQLESFLDKHMKGTSQRDDILLIGIKV